MPLIKCLDCPVFFLRYNSRSVRCKPCREAHIAKTKMDWQHKHRGRPRLDPPDMTDEEVDRRFDAALKEIRRQKRPETEFGWNAAWKYSEPGR